MHIKGNVNRLTIQPDYEITVELDGTMKGQITFEGDRQYIDQQPTIGQSHPDDTRLHCYAYRRVFSKLRKCKVICDYIGLFNDPTTPVWELVGSLSQEKIDTHPQFSIFAGSIDQEKNKAVFDPDTGAFVCFPPDAPSNLGGIESYYVPSVIWRKTWWQTNAPQPTGLGQITPKPGKIVLPAGVVDGLTSNFTYRQVGFCFQVTEEVMGSGKGGWNKIIYK